MHDTTRPSPARPEMPFIISTVEKVDAATRKLIRSHVMQGRKKRNKAKRPTSWAVAAGPTPTTRVELEDLTEIYEPLIPGRIGGDWSFLHLADEMEPPVLRNLIKFPNVAARIMSPLIVAIGEARANREWLDSLHLDAAFLHITAFAVEGFIKIVLLHQGDGKSLPAMLHFQKGMRLLRERLTGDNDIEKISDSTCGIVVKLAQAAHFTGDSYAAQQHMQGLRQMVDLKGGLDVLRGKNLLVEMVKCDLGTALLDGSDTVFFRQPAEDLIAYPTALLPNSDDRDVFQGNMQWIRNIDKDLATAWGVMRRFCLLVDLGAQTRRRMPADFIHDTMMAVMYRLLYMRFADDSVEEAVRLGLLAFCHHIFLQWQDVRLLHLHFPILYRECVLNLRHVEGVSSDLALWLLMIGAISVFDLSDDSSLRDCFRENASKCKIKTWSKMQNTLKSFLWIPLLDEHVGKTAYDALTSMVEKK